MDNENIEVKQSLAEVRREARKRKILENAINRLDKIAGKELNGLVRDGDAIYINKTSVSTNENKQINENTSKAIQQKMVTADAETATKNVMKNLINTEEHILKMINELNNLQATIENNPLLNDSEIFQMPQPNQTQLNNNNLESIIAKENTLTKIFKLKIPIILLSILTYYLLTSFESDIFSKNVFLIFLLWELTEIVIFKTYENSKINFLTIIFLLLGIPAIHSQRIIIWFKMVYKIFIDLQIFLFFFLLIYIFSNFGYSSMENITI